MKKSRYTGKPSYVAIGYKSCRVCGKVKKKKKNFRYTSHVCHACEAKQVEFKRQRICKICHEVKERKDFRVVFAPNNSLSKTCRICEEAAGIFKFDDNCASNGFIYILYDNTFPELIKIGCTTNLDSRLYHYNKNKPVDTCKYIYISTEFDKVFKIEKNILKQIKKFTRPIDNRKE